MRAPAGTNIPLNERNPLTEVWLVAWPTVLTMTSYTVMQFIDALMVSQVGPLELSAQGNGAIWAFTPIAVVMGFLTVVNTYVAQNLGAGTPERSPRYAWAAMWMTIVIWALVFLPIAALLPWLFAALQNAEAIEQFDRLLRLESHYGQILLTGAVFMLCGRGLHHFFFGLHRPKVVAVSAIAGNIANVVSNYVLIFGYEGLPAWGLPGVPGVPVLGVYGAALGTVIGGFVEFVIPLAIFLGPKLNRELNTRQAWRITMRPVRDLARIGWPAGTQTGNEIICFAIFMSVLVGYFGQLHMAAGWIALRYMHLSFMPAVGFSVAVTSIVGRYIGARQPDTAVGRARFAVGLAIVYMTICGLLFFVFREPLVRFFVAEHVSPAEAEQIVAIGAKLMICAAIFQALDAVGIVYTGALRGAGDTVWPGVMTVVLSWTFLVGGGWALIHLAPQLKSVGPWIGAALYIGIYGVVMAVRFESGRWRRIRVLRLDDEEDVPVKPMVQTAAGPVPAVSPADAETEPVTAEPAP